MGRRYGEHCARFEELYLPVEIPSHALERRWHVRYFMDEMGRRIKSGQLAAAEMGLEMLEEDSGFPFGSIVKSNLGRALGKPKLCPSQVERVQARVADMLIRNFLPKEFRQYAWLCRRLGGLGAQRALVERRADRSRPWVDWYIRYLTQANPPAPPARW